MADFKNFLPKIAIYSPWQAGACEQKNWFVYYLKDGKRKRVYGKINQETTYAGRMKVAKVLLAKVTAEFEQGLHRTLKEKVEELLEEKKLFLRRKSYTTICSKIKIFLAWLGTQPLTPETAKAFFHHLLKTRHSTTYNAYRQTLTQIFKELGYEHCFEEIKTRSGSRTPARYFQPHHIKRLKARIEEADPELWLFIQFLFYCFIRPGELRLLRAGDILLDEARILVRAEISKNKRAQYVAIPDAFLPSLKQLQRLTPSELIFRDDKDASKPLAINRMANRHRKILKELGFGVEYKLYSWKHTGSVMVVKAGGNLKELQVQLRHHSLDQVDEYLRQMGVQDLSKLQRDFPAL